MKKVIYIFIFYMMFQVSFAYTDVNESYWANSYICDLQEKNIISGYPDNSFRPENNIKKSEFITMLAKALEVVNKGTENHVHWAIPYVEFGKDKGFLARDYDKEELEKSITRFEAMEMIINCYSNTKNAYMQEGGLKNKFIDLENKDYKVKNIANILDFCTIFNGYPDSTMRINNNITRAEASTIISNFIKNKDRLEKFKMSNVIEVYELGIRTINLDQLPFDLQEKQDGIKNETKVITRINNIEFFKCDENYNGNYKEAIAEIYNLQLPYFEYRKKIADGNFIIAVDFTTINQNLIYETTSGYNYLKILFPEEPDIKILDSFDFEEMDLNKKGQGYNGVILEAREEHRTTAFFVVDGLPDKKVEFTRSITTMYDPANKAHVNINSSDKLLINLEEICEE